MCKSLLHTPMLADLHPTFEYVSSEGYGKSLPLLLDNAISTIIPCSFIPYFQITEVTTDALSTVTADITSSVVTDITSNAAEATTHIYDTYNYFVHPHWYDFPLVSDEWHYIVGVYITIVGFTGVFGNGLVIYIFSRY